MNYLSVCSGIEAASVAWKPLGWNCVGVSEIEPLPCSVLKHRFPDVRNFGDMTRFEEWDVAEDSIDVVAGGTPCQDLSQGGLGAGWFGKRSGLSWSYVGIIEKHMPRWFVWENVQGAIRGKNREGFIRFIKAFDELGFCVSWRVLDARYFGCAQRRPRVFVVGSLRNECSRQVLLESEGKIGIDTQATQPTVSVCLTARGPGSLDDRETYVTEQRGIRHMTPVEFERCMGFEDNWTLVEHRGKMASDTARYRSVGNSMAVPVMAWIGQRINNISKEGV